ncbi:MAG: hypothetical protein AABY05_03345 [Nanoarchaeota archaeon]
MVAVKADLHNHLRTSSNIKKSDLNHAVDVAGKRLGSHGIIGLVNFSDKRYEMAICSPGYERDYLGTNRNGVRVYGDKGTVIIVKGQEFPTKQGHLLVLGLEAEKHLKEGRTLKETVAEAKDNNGIIVADHPYYRDGIGSYLEKHQALLKDFSAFEVHNGEAAFSLPLLRGMFPKDANYLASVDFFIFEKDFPRLGALSSSDGHSFYEIGKSWTALELPDMGSNFVETLRNSIEATNLETERKNKDAIRGSVDHMIDLALICKVAPKIGLGRMFETDRP